MHVALVANRLAGTAPTGVDRYHRALVHQLAPRGDLRCTTLSTSERHLPTWVPAPVVARHVPGPRKAVHLAWTTVGLPRIDRWVGGADLVHVTVPSFPVPSRAPVIYTIHDLMTHLHPEWFGRVHAWGGRAALEDAAGRAAGLVANSPSTAAAARAVLGVDPDRVTVIPLGVDDEFLAPVDPHDAARAATRLGVEPGRFVLYVGQVHERKNLLVLLRAMARLDRPRPLVIAGAAGSGSAAVTAEIDRLRLADRVRLAGYVPDRELPALMAAAGVLAHPSRFEGFGLTPLEAMAVGTPAIVSDAGALPDTVGGVALLAGPDDADGWAAAIQSLDDPEVATDLGRRGREHAAGFTWARAGDAHVALYRQVLDGRMAGAAAWR